MKHEYRLSTSNKIYLGVVMSLSILLFILQRDKSSYETGRFFGGVVALIIFPMLFAWIAWRLSGRKIPGGSTTFNVILTLMLLARISQYTSDIGRSSSVPDLQKHTERFKNNIVHAENQEEADAAVAELADSVKSELDSLYESSTGSEKRFYRIMKEIVQETQTMGQDWSASYDATLSPRMLDYSLLNSDEEFEYRIGVYERYIEKTRVYQDHMENMVSNMKNRLSVLGPNNEFARGAIEGAGKQRDLQMPFFEPLNKAHISRGETMILILALLREHRSDWSLENDELAIHNEAVSDRYDELVETLIDRETTINEMTLKLLEVL
ncbi:MAG: hypothetical protein ACYSWQ_01485 [Planctomycetota bacterium]